MKSLNLLICDDEWLIREQIARGARDMDQFCVYTADNGKSAWDIVQKEGVDALILDVRMPEMDGIELIKRISTMENAPVTVILSGHDEFDYARQCLRYGAVDYHLKPVTDEQIQAILSDLAQRVGRRMEYISTFASYKNKLDSIRPVLLDHFFQDLLQKKLNEAEIQNAEGYLGMCVNRPYLVISVVSIRGIHEESPEVRDPLRIYALAQLLEDRLRCTDFHISVIHLSNDMLGVVACGDRADIDDCLNVHLEKALKEISGDLLLRFSVGMGDVVDRPILLRNSYVQALYALSYSEDDQSVNMIASRDVHADAAQMDISRVHASLRGLLSTVTARGAEQSMRELLAILNDYEASSAKKLDQVIADCCYIASIALDLCGQNEKILNANPIYKIASQTTEASVYKYTHQLLQTAIDLNKVQRKDRRQMIAEACRNMIDQDYGDHIGIQELSDRLNVSRNYLSTVFKRETGYSVNEYLNAVRMQHARHLLRDTDMKIYAIAERLGFADTYYFSAAFKKAVGISPSEYRENRI